MLFNHSLLTVMIVSSICAITAVRIRVTKDISDHVNPYGYRLISFLATLEDSLGVVNACLPTLKPVFDRLSAKALWTSASEITSQTVDPSSSARIYRRKGHALISARPRKETGTAAGADVERDRTETPAPPLELQKIPDSRVESRSAHEGATFFWATDDVDTEPCKRQEFL